MRQRGNKSRESGIQTITEDRKKPNTFGNGWQEKNERWIFHFLKRAIENAGSPQKTVIEERHVAIKMEGGKKVL